MTMRISKLAEKPPRLAEGGLVWLLETSLGIGEVVEASVKLSGTDSIHFPDRMTLTITVREVPTGPPRDIPGLRVSHINDVSYMQGKELFTKMTFDLYNCEFADKILDCFKVRKT